MSGLAVKITNDKGIEICKSRCVPPHGLNHEMRSRRAYNIGRYYTYTHNARYTILSPSSLIHNIEQRLFWYLDSEVEVHIGLVQGVILN